ncbi:MAG: hypothetical protein U0768_13710 [Anaerolineae bacterium]
MAHAIDSPEYWQSFSATKRDLDRVEEMFYEDGLPHPLDVLAERVIQGRREEAAAEAARHAGAKLYQPKHSYQVGERLRFAALHNAVGEVVAVRPGENADLPPFNVIRVRFESSKTEREFAADYAAEHPLNVEQAVSAPASGGDWVGHVSRVLAQKLVENPEYIVFGDDWFRRDLMLDVHVGHLNIAEALIDVAGEPQPTETLLADVELPPAAPAARAFALNYALAHDDEERFINEGTADAPRWALRGASSS